MAASSSSSVSRGGDAVRPQPKKRPAKVFILMLSASAALSQIVTQDGMVVHVHVLCMCVCVCVHVGV